MPVPSMTRSSARIKDYRRLSAWVGILFVVLFVASLIAGNVLTTVRLFLPDATAEQLRSYYTGNSTAIVVQGLLQPAASGSLALFVVDAARQLLLTRSQALPRHGEPELPPVASRPVRDINHLDTITSEVVKSLAKPSSSGASERPDCGVRTLPPGADFSVPGVARAADVARVTVYNQFGSKAGLLDALSDQLARAAGLHRMSDLLATDAATGLGGFIDIFTRFWSSDRLLIRRLRAVAALDPELEKSLAARDARRRHGVTVLLSRLDQQGHAQTLDRDTAVTVVTTLTSFETFDSLAGADEHPDRVAVLIRGLVQ